MLCLYLTLLVDLSRQWCDAKHDSLAIIISLADFPGPGANEVY